MPAPARGYGREIWNMTRLAVCTLLCCGTLATQVRQDDRAETAALEKLYVT